MGTSSHTSNKLRALVPPALGGGTVASAVVLMGSGPVVACAIGGLVWAGAALVLKPRDPFEKLKSTLSKSQEHKHILTEIDESSGRLENIRILASKPEATQIAESLNRIVAATEAIIGDLIRNPKDYSRMRKPVRHYLKHAETVAERFVYINSVQETPPETQQRIKKTLHDLAGVYSTYQTKMVADEEFDLDARIELLENEIRSEQNK